MQQIELLDRRPRLSVLRLAIFLSPFSVSTRRYPFVAELAILSEMPARRLAFELRPETLALSEDEIVIIPIFEIC